LRLRATRSEVPIVSGNVEPLQRDRGLGDPAHAHHRVRRLASLGGGHRHALVQTRGDVVLALGALPAEAGTLGGSEFLVLKNPWRLGWRASHRSGAGGALQHLVLGLARQHMLASAHDVSEGGLAVALQSAA